MTRPFQTQRPTLPPTGAVGPDRNPSPRAVRATQLSDPIGQLTSPFATTASRAGRAIETEINHERMRQPDFAG